MAAELNLKIKKEGEDYSKNTLYSILNDTKIIFQEKHDDSGDDFVNLIFEFEDGQEGIYAKEYRSSLVKKIGGKTADILCIKIDKTKKIVCSYIMDVKRDITGFDVANDLKSLQAESVERINHLIEQLDDSNTYNKTLMVFYPQYSATVKFGVVTRQFDEENIQHLIDKFESAISDCDNISKGVNELIAKNARLKILPYKKSVKLLKLLKGHKVEIDGEVVPLNVYIMHGNDAISDYSCDIYIE